MCKNTFDDQLEETEYGSTGNMSADVWNEEFQSRMDVRRQAKKPIVCRLQTT